MFYIVTLIVTDSLFFYDINYNCNALMMNIYYIQSSAVSLGRGMNEVSYKYLPSC